MNLCRLGVVILGLGLAAPAWALEEAILNDGSGQVIVPYAIEKPASLAAAGTTDPARQVGLIVCFHEHDHKAPVEVQVVNESLQRLGLTESFVVIGMQDGTKHGYSMVEDHERASKLIAWARSQFPINPRRIYLWGRGEGAKMAGEFGTEHPELVAGLITYSWGFWKLPAVRDAATNLPEFYVVLGLKDLVHHLWTVREAYARIKALGYSVIYREAEGLGGPTRHPVTNDDALSWIFKLRHNTLALSAAEQALLKPFSGRSIAPDPAAFKALALVGGRAAGAALAQALSAENPKTRALAAKTFTEANFGRVAAEALADRLKDAAVEVRRATILALGVAAHWRLLPAQEALVRFVGNPAIEVAERRLAVDALSVATKLQVRGSYQDPALFGALIGLLDDDDVEIRKKAINILGPILITAYRPDAPRAERQAAQMRFREWLALVTPRF